MRRSRKLGGTAMRDVGVRHGCEKISLKVTVLPGLDGDPTLLSGFVARQPEWASSHVVAAPGAPARTYRELSDVLATQLGGAPDVLSNRVLLHPRCHSKVHDRELKV